jgi:hypothetical protein
MSASRKQRLAKLRKQWSLNAVAARERHRIERSKESGEWTPIGTLLIGMRAAPDGRHMSIAVHGFLDWTICGTERSIRAALAKVMRKRFEQNRNISRH